MRLPIGFEMLRQTLARRPYRLYLLSNTTSNLGAWIERVAVALGALACAALWAWSGRIRGPMAAALETAPSPSVAI